MRCVIHSLLTLSVLGALKNDTVELDNVHIDEFTSSINIIGSDTGWFYTILPKVVVVLHDLIC